MSLNLTSALLAIVVFQLLFISFFLLTSKRGKRKSNVLLGIFFLMTGISILDIWLSIHGLYIYYLRLAFLDDGFILAFGPLILLYVRTIMYADYQFRKSHLIHFIPFFIVTAYFGVISFVPSNAEQRQLIEDVQNFNLPAIVNLIGVLFYLHSLAYLFLSYLEVLRYKKMIYEEYSSAREKNVEWLEFTLRSLAVLIFLAIIHAIVPYSIFESYMWISALFFIGFIFYFSNRVILKGLVNPGLFGGIDQENLKKYAGSTLTPEERKTLKNSLEKIMIHQKPYLQPDLTINQLAVITGVTSKVLSQVINQSYHKSFFDFVNTYRVEEAKQIFENSDDPKLTVLEVMYQSGFNSKSSFIAFFKKETGVTPSDYKKQKT